MNRAKSSKIRGGQHDHRKAPGGGHEREAEAAEPEQEDLETPERERLGTSRRGRDARWEPGREPVAEQQRELRDQSEFESVDGRRSERGIDAPLREYLRRSPWTVGRGRLRRRAWEGAAHHRPSPINQEVAGSRQPYPFRSQQQTCQGTLIGWPVAFSTNGRCPDGG
jgi:hypothetical protein